MFLLYVLDELRGKPFLVFLSFVLDELRGKPFSMVPTAHVGLLNLPP